MFQLRQGVYCRRSAAGLISGAVLLTVTYKYL